MCMKYSVWVRIPLYEVCSDLYTLLNKVLHVKLCNDKLYRLNSNCKTKVLSASVIGWGQCEQLYLNERAEVKSYIIKRVSVFSKR